jgi:hypothetical protein
LATGRGKPKIDPGAGVEFLRSAQQSDERAREQFPCGAGGSLMRCSQGIRHHRRAATVMTMSSHRQYAAVSVALACGALLMTLPGPPPAAADAAADGLNVLLLTDFKTGSPDLGWYVQNDNVIGGRSQGGFEIREQGLPVFSGSTNTDGGGFSSIRTRSFARLDLSKYDGIELRAKADGK